MRLSSLTPEQLHGAVLYGCESIISQCELLNSINIFPVADRDTGSNLTSTAKAVITYSTVKSSIDETLESIAEASLLGARGNSGMIFSQFFNGLTQENTPDNQIDLRQFKQRLIHAASSVRNALLSPVEGTMLTIMESWAALLNQSANQFSCFNQAMRHLLPDLKHAVERTTETLAALKATHLVDAGALGFYHFVDGFSQFLLNPAQAIQVERAPVFEHTTHETLDASAPPAYRYCTEGIVRGHDLSQDALTALLSKQGDSIVLSGTKNVYRFHLHTDTPWHVFTQLIEFGTIEHPKVDDMLRQVEVSHHRQHKIALVTDSSADLPEAIKDHYQIHTIPLNLHLDNHHLLDGYSFEPNEFYEKLKGFTHYPKTSLPSALLIEERLGYLSKHYDEVLVISLSQALSGTCEAFQAAAKKFNNIHVMNSKMSSGAQGLLVHYAAELIAENHPIEFVKDRLEQSIDKTHIFILPNEFDALIRSGRIGKIAGKIAQLSGIKPILTLDAEGKGNVFSKASNRKNAVMKLMASIQDLLDKSGMTLYKYCIVHAGDRQKADDFCLLASEVLNQSPDYIEDVSAAIGLHAGQGAVALALMMQ